MSIIKTKEEIAKLREAAILGDKCFEYICNYIKVGMTEKDIAKEMDNYMLNEGALRIGI